MAKTAIDRKRIGTGMLAFSLVGIVLEYFVTRLVCWFREKGIGVHILINDKNSYPSLLPTFALPLPGLPIIVHSGTECQV